MASREYHQNYYKNNKNHWKINNKEYYQLHREALLQVFKEYREENKGLYLYKFIEDDEISYIGSTTSLIRLQQHLTSNTQLKLTKEDVNNLNGIQYKEFEEGALTREELYMLENYYIDKFKPVLNKDLNKFTREWCRSIEELLEIEKELEWNNFDISRYQLQ